MSRRLATPCQTTVGYASAAELRQLIAKSAPLLVQRLQAADMLSVKEAAQLAGTTVATVRAWGAQGRAIALKAPGIGIRLPRWQFEPSMWDVLPRLSAALGTPEGWALLTFLETSHGAFGGYTPRQAIEQGEGERAIDVAAHEGF